MPVAKKNTRAFSLIELLIVMAIISIMTAVVIVSMSAIRTRNDVESSAREFAAVLREVQGYALTGKQVAAPDEDPCSTAYRVAWNMDQSVYALIYRIKNGAGACQRKTSIPYTLRSGVVFGAKSSLFFMLPRGEVQDDRGAAITVVQGISMSKNGISALVCVYPSGAITSQVGIDTCPSAPQ